MEEVLDAIKEELGLDFFTPVQEEVIRHILGGNDALVLMPSGEEKSLCFQVPAMLMDGMAVVITPMISRMAGEVDALRSSGVAAGAINSLMDSSASEEIRSRCADGREKLLYLSPERLKEDLDWLKANVDVSLIVVDQAQCVSARANTFWPEYKLLGSLHTLFPGVPIVAFTADTDEVTKEDILTKLDLRGRTVFVGPFEKPGDYVRGAYMARQKQIHKNAYAKWSKEDDRLLAEKYQAGVSVKDLAAAFARNEGAIQSRLKKLGLEHTCPA